MGETSERFSLSPREASELCDSQSTLIGVLYLNLHINSRSDASRKMAKLRHEYEDFEEYILIT